MHFKNTKELLDWLDGKRLMPDKCDSNTVGTDGSHRHSPEPHQHKIKLPINKSITADPIYSVSCDNHLGAYLACGWVELLRLCRDCHMRTATVCIDGTSGVPDLCEDCLDSATAPGTEAQRLKNEGYCLNRELVHGCTVYALTGSQYCAFCSKQGFTLGGHLGASKTLKRSVKIRTIPQSARPCKLTPGCAGTMTGAVRSFRDGEKPQLWWGCEICGANKLAESTSTVPDPQAGVKDLDTSLATSQEAADNLAPTGMAEVVDNIREMLSE